MVQGFQRSDSLNAPVQVTAAIMVKDRKILIAQRGPEAHQAGKWEFPGGKVENNETPEQCLEREMMEEFNIVVSIGEYLGASIYHYDHISIELMAFRAFWTGRELVLNEHAAIAWVPVSELDRYDFAAADLQFVEQLTNGEIEIGG